MGQIVGGVAALGLKIDRDPAVLGDGEDEEELLEVGPVVLVVAPGDREPGLILAFLLLVRILVVAVEGDGGGVVVQLVESDRELADGVGGDGQGEGAAVVLEEPVETASDAIVVEGDDLVV